MLAGERGGLAGGGGAVAIAAITLVVRFFMAINTNGCAGKLHGFVVCRGFDGLMAAHA